MALAIKDRVSEALSIGRRIRLNNAWSSFMTKYLLSDNFLDGYRSLHEDADRNLYKYKILNEWFLPFKIINPHEVKAVVLCKEPIIKSTLPYPWITNNDNRFRPVYFNMLKDQAITFDLQCQRKYSGTKYKDHVKNAKDYSHLTVYKLALKRVKEELNLTKTVDIEDIPFRTYNWYAQGLLMLNINYFKYFPGMVTNIMTGLAANGKTTIATYNDEVRRNYNNYFPELTFSADVGIMLNLTNNAIEKEYGSKAMINFLI